MTEDSEPDGSTGRSTVRRRRLLTALGGATAFGLTGCIADEISGGDGAGGDGSSGGDGESGDSGNDDGGGDGAESSGDGDGGGGDGDGGGGDGSTPESTPTETPASRPMDTATPTATEAGGFVSGDDPEKCGGLTHGGYVRREASDGPFIVTFEYPGQRSNIQGTSGSETAITVQQSIGEETFNMFRSSGWTGKTSRWRPCVANATG